MLINCDIGERGVAHPIDNKLMGLIDMANIACGGHAGNRESVEYYMYLARENGIKPTAHISYPDRENFGRASMDIPFHQLKKAIDEQYALMPTVKAVKFHGALYNDANIKPDLAEFLVEWLMDNSIETIVTPADSLLAKACRDVGLTICPEAFAERRYRLDKGLAQLLLVPRSKSYASITDCEEAIAQSKSIIDLKKVDIYMEDETGNLTTEHHNIDAETICIHSDSAIALELAKGLRSL